MRLRNKKALIFDLDGCLLDTSLGIKESVIYTLNKLGIEGFDGENLEKFIGPPIQSSLIDFCHLSTEAAQRGADIFRDYYKNKALLKAELYPGIKNTLIKFKNRGFKLAVATYKREDYAITLLKSFNLAECFDVIHGGDNYNRLSKGDIIGLCLSDMDCYNNEAVMIGDTLNDAKGAYALNMDFIGVTWGFGFKSHNSSLGYDIFGFADKPHQLLDMISE